MNDAWHDALLKYLEQLPQSPSHSKEHLERVLGYCLELQARYGGDREILTAAALLHDIGRTDVRHKSAESARVAADLAEPILREVSFPVNKIGQVCSAIAQHDQPNLTPDSIEGRILKESDFLAGFGAWGILRVAMFQGERHQSTSEVLQRLNVKMQRRIASLEFPESRVEAEQEYLFVKLFLSLLDRPPKLTSVELPGNYIVLEGISGSGKTTQAEILGHHLQAQGQETLLVSEPRDKYRELLRQTEGIEEQLHILLADRISMAQNIILPALKAGKLVISSRSYVSGLVYQTTHDLNTAYVHFLHRSLPVPDLIILLDIPAEVAYERVLIRQEKTGQPLGKNESLKALVGHRQKFKEVIADFDQAVTLDGAESEEAVAAKVWSQVIRLLPKEVRQR